ncbi:hypothetical protein [Clostridium tunisiense]|uniref:hypothetical protein n=1 Tax=Clostridium tunisiense TaxID=219748 RepID=UPI00031BA33D|nr:hypothetical protein [Clostridium tunisiense]
MDHIFMRAFVFCQIIGIIITCFALLNLVRISKKHKSLTNEEYLFKKNIAIRKKYLIVGIVGMIICLLTQIVVIFIR